MDGSEKTEPVHSLLYAGRYAVEAEIGRGAMGRVMRARDLRIGREVALKILIPGAQRERFEHEARAAGGLDHPNIVAVHDVGEEGGEPFIVTELLRGRTLRDALGGGPLHAAEALDFAIQLADGLAAAHRAGIVHRDLKPENLFITESGRLKILDFGIAKLQKGAASFHTEQGTVLGTPAYMSPEQVRGERADARSDVFACGSVLHETLTGKPPFRRDDDFSTAYAIVNDAPVRLEGPLAAIVRRCLEKDPAGRYADAGHLLADLRTVARGEAAAAVRRTRLRLVPPAIALIASICAAAWFVFKRASGRDATLNVMKAVLPSSDIGSATSIAVLPFVDMSEKKDQEYFSDGLSEELIDLLTNIPALRVPARTSSFYFKGKQSTIAEIGKTLGVSHVLEGSVRKSVDTLRVTAQLVRTDNGYHVWSETYDRKLDDVFKVQDDIAAAVVKALKVSLLAEGPLLTAGTRNVEANDLFLQARFHWTLGSRADIDQAADLLTRALALDSGFARAWAMLSRARIAQARYHLVPDSELERARLDGRNAAEKAVALDPALDEGHTALGRVWMWLDNDIAKAAVEYRRALEINPRSADATVQLSTIALKEGRIEDHLRLAQRALALDPLDFNVMTIVGEAHLAKGDPNAAEAVFRKERDLAPNDMFVDWDLGITLAVLGKELPRALELFERSARAEEHREWARALLYPALGRTIEGDAILASLEKNRRSLDPRDIAAIYAFRGEKDRAFEWLERQYQTDPTKMKGTSSIAYSNFLRPLRDDPRYAALLRRLK